MVFSLTRKELDLGLSKMPTDFYRLESVNCKKDLEARMRGRLAHNMKVCRSDYALQPWNGAF